MPLKGTTPLGGARRGQIPPFIVMDVMRTANARAAAGRDIVHLEVGQPATPAPRAVRDAARDALASEPLGYTDACGLEPLRRRIAGHYRDTYGVTVDWRRVVVTTGSSGAFILGFLAAFDAGDRVAVTTPGYPAYRNILRALDVDVVMVPTTAASGYQPRLDDLDALVPAVRGLIAASPANPTGSMLAGPDLSRLVKGCAERGIRLISDEIYHGITYTMAAATALAHGNDVIVVNSFSKYYSMTGWRLGWMVVPAPLMRAVECLAQNLFISPPALSQRAAITAFDARDELDANVRRYARNRDILLSGLPAAGLKSFAPADGAFYLYADVSALTDDSAAYCRRMLDEAGVAATPGIDFDLDRGRRFVRFSYAGSEPEMDDAIRRLAAWQRGT
jgi:aspartate/methionine/tyrosine aminotransferase